MSLQLRDKLRLPVSCGDKELWEACNRYYRIYKNIEEAATDPFVKKIAADKLDDLVESAAREGITLDGAEDYGVTCMRSIASWDVEKSFNDAALTNEILTPSQATKLNEKISTLPESPKKHYLRFTVEKNEGPLTSESIKLLQRTIERAIEGDPENPLYRQIFTDLSEAVKVNEVARKEWERKKQREIDNKRRMDTTKRVLKFLGSGTFRLLGAGFAATAALIICMWNCFFNDC